ncbi:multiheme c-type cytochrome [candidate division KSB1 bacterium]
MLNKKMGTSGSIFLLLTISLLAVVSTAQEDGGLHEKMAGYDRYDDPIVCRGCHEEKFEVWETSQMSRSFSGDFFQAQYYDVVLKDAAIDPRATGEVSGCIACHSPSAFMAGDLPPERSKNPDTAWQSGGGDRHLAERGVFCDFCHTIKDFKGDIGFNGNYESAAIDGINPKFGDFEYAWSPYHPSESNDLFEMSELCGTCHNEKNSFGVWVKATEFEYLDGPYPDRQVVCQTCHMPPVDGKPAKMGPHRPPGITRKHWFGGGFSTFVEGAARVSIKLDRNYLRAGQEVPFQVLVHSVAPGHKFPTGSTEERDVWLHVSVLDEDGNEVDHIRVQPNPSDPNDQYFIASNAKVAYPTYSKHPHAQPLERDCAPEGDRIYQSIFLDPDGEVTFGQWYCAREIENRLKPLEERLEKYVWQVPASLSGKKLTLSAVLNYRRMADSHADYLKIPRRPVIEVGRDEVRVDIGS